MLLGSSMNRYQEKRPLVESQSPHSSQVAGVVTEVLGGNEYHEKMKKHEDTKHCIACHMQVDIGNFGSMSMTLEVSLLA